MTDRKKIVVIGFGNPLFTDEGIGNAIVAALLNQPDIAAVVDLLDLGTKGAVLLHAISGRAAAVIIDAARMGEPPGTIRRFTLKDVRNKNPAPFLSLHEASLFETLALSRLIGDCPGQIVFFGIQPLRVAPERKLTRDLAAHLCEYIKAVSSEIRFLA